MFYANQTKILPLLIPWFSFDMKAQHVIFFLSHNASQYTCLFIFCAENKPAEWNGKE